jgi:hypothetical protein
MFLGKFYSLKMYGRVEVYNSHMLKSTIDGGECLIDHMGALTPRPNT